MTSPFRPLLHSRAWVSLPGTGLWLPGGCGIVHLFPFVRLLANVSKSLAPSRTFLRLLPGLAREGSPSRCTSAPRARTAPGPGREPGRSLALRFHSESMLQLGMVCEDEIPVAGDLCVSEGVCVLCLRCPGPVLVSAWHG